MRKFLIAAALMLGTIAETSIAARNVRVVDGDTIELNGETFRLHGIDAPEAGQQCTLPLGKSWPCGKAAIRSMEDLVLDKAVQCDSRGSDGYGRTIGVCTVNGADINAAMISAGMAWAFRKYSLDYAKLEDVAHQNRVGVWQAPTETPWDFREAKWAVSQQEAPNGCPIKGNVSGGGYIYHAPWSPWYDRTKVSLQKGERWFCTEAEAVAAGWRAPYWGR
ncbi:thermonuclease family protein [Neorhizobium galegae]|uniref:thermonuclease family protein n=1 Tax=Neorhizobium galegae TaxID=399 RepID=UPI0006221260|nr:thermonuclease family protein [Neorhizobium galegae]MCQ1781111.1 thermonuclease family protein [Neorhizobium galegae]MCQ1797712.1 thermonuclease family protein [Neorhizobium galegae]CDZ30982.1 Nuclease (SNase domain protein) [Neorhizobium galegae bv. officinalis]